MAYPLYSIPAPGDAPRRVVARGETEVLRLGEPGRGRRLVEIPIEGTGACFVYEAHPPRLRAVAAGREDGPALVEVNAVGAYARNRRYDIEVLEGRLQVLAEGIHAFGAAGRVNGGPHVLALVEPGTVFRLNAKYETYVYVYSGGRDPWQVMTLGEYRLRERAQDAARHAAQAGPVYRCLTLRGNAVERGIPVERGRIPFRPGWGFTRREQFLAAVILRRPEEVERIYYARVVDEEGPVLRPARRPRERRVPELVLVQEYYTGSGGKRWPGFHVRYDRFVRVLAHAHTEKGSGAEEWRLVIAPAGWARNIARQFVNERDYPDQTIAYRPRLRWTGIRLEVGEPGQALVHLEADPALVAQGVEEMAAEGWLTYLEGMFVHIFGDAAAVAAFVLRAPLTAFTVNAALVVPPQGEEVRT